MLDDVFDYLSIRCEDEAAPHIHGLVTHKLFELFNVLTHLLGFLPQFLCLCSLLFGFNSAAATILDSFRFSNVPLEALRISPFMHTSDSPLAATELPTFP